MDGDADHQVGADASRESALIVMSADKARTVRSFAWSAIEGAGLSVISFVSLVAFSRILGPGDFGLFATALSLFELLSLISNLAFHDALVQIPDLTPRHRDTAFTLTVLVSVAFAVLFWLGSPLFATAMHDARAGAILTVLGISFIFNGLSATLTAQQRRNFEFRKLALRSLVGRISGALLGVVAALYGLGVWSLVIQQVCIALLSTIVLWLACDDRPRFGFDRRVARELIAFGVGAAGAEFVNSGIKRLFVVACGVLLTTTIAGYINLAFRLVDTLWGVTATAIYQVVLPTMSRLQGDRDALFAMFRQAQRYTATLLYAAFMLMAATSDRLVVVLFGVKWLPGAPYVALLCLTMVSQAPRMLTVPILTAMGRPRDVLVGYSWGMAYMAIVVVAVPFRSGMAAMAIWAGTELVYAPVFAWLLWRRTGVSPIAQVRNIAWALLAGAAAYGAAAWVNQIIAASTKWGSLIAVPACCVLGGTAFALVLAVFDRATLYALVEGAGHFLPGRTGASDQTRPLIKET